MTVHTALVASLLLLLADARAGEPPAPADGSPAPGVAGVTPGVVDGATAHRLVASGVKVLDVRTPEEFATGHVPGAVNIPHDQIAQRAGELGPPSTPLLLYCRSGRRTELAAKVLKEKGFTTLYDLRSYDAWVQSEPRK